MPKRRTPLENPEVAAAIQSAAESGRWLIAVWRVEEGRLVPHFTTHEFPVGDFPEAEAQLQRWADTQ